MATDLTASRLMVRQAARFIDESSPMATTSSAMAKKFATDACFNVQIKWSSLLPISLDLQWSTPDSWRLWILEGLLHPAILPRLPRPSNPWRNQWSNATYYISTIDQRVKCHCIVYSFTTVVTIYYSKSFRSEILGRWPSSNCREQERQNRVREPNDF